MILEFINDKLKFLFLIIWSNKGEKNLTRILLTVALIILSVWLLLPTYKDYVYTKELSELRGKDSADYVNERLESIRKARNKRLKLGLDLKGGMYVVMDVDVVKLLDDLANPKTKDEVLTSILDELKEIAKTTDEPILKIFVAKLKERGKPYFLIMVIQGRMSLR